MPQTALSILFIINPFSGQDRHEWEKEISDHFSGTQHTIRFHTLSQKCDENTLKKVIAEIAPDRVIAVGGDGTVTLVARAVKGTEIALGILPAGSANGMARELQIPIDVSEALDLIIEGEIKKTDLLDINGHVCLHLSDVGMNALLIKYFEEGNRRGKLGYAKVLLKVLLRKKYMQVTIETDKTVVLRNALVVIFANASKYGFGAVINPEGNLHDGLFEVVIVRRLALSELLKMWFRPQPFNPKKIETLHAKKVKIEMKHKAYFQVDGEYLGKVTRVEAKILPKSLRLILPIIREV